MSDDVKHSAIWGFVVALAIGAMVFGGGECAKRSADSYKACLDTGHSPLECRSYPQ